MEDEEVGEVDITLNHNFFQILETHQVVSRVYVKLQQFFPDISKSHHLREEFGEEFFVFESLEGSCNFCEQVQFGPVRLIAEEVQAVVVQQGGVLGNDFLPQNERDLALLRVYRKKVVLVNELQEFMDCGELLILIAFPLVLDNQALNHLVQRQH